MFNHRVRIKMCGMTREQDVLHAAALGVDAIGLIFYPNSKRYVTIAQAKAIISNLPVFVDVVAVLVNPEVETVHQLLNTLPIQYLQFHGNETPAFCEQFHWPYIKAVAVTSATVIQQAMQLYYTASAIVLDTPTSHEWGGTGKQFDWHLIPAERDTPIILAGGLHVDNVQQAVAMCHPYAVDLSSGIEDEPGIKNHQKMMQLVNRLEKHDIQ